VLGELLIGEAVQARVLQGDADIGGQGFQQTLGFLAERPVRQQVVGDDYAQQVVANAQRDAEERLHFQQPEDPAEALAVQAAGIVHQGGAAVAPVIQQGELVRRRQRDFQLLQPEPVFRGGCRLADRPEDQGLAPGVHQEHQGAIKVKLPGEDGDHVVQQIALVQGGTEGQGGAAQAGERFHLALEGLVGELQGAGDFRHLRGLDLGLAHLFGQLGVPQAQLVLQLAVAVQRPGDHRREQGDPGQPARYRGGGDRQHN